jgi:hypothetical protein
MGKVDKYRKEGNGEYGKGWDQERQPCDEEEDRAGDIQQSGGHPIAIVWFVRCGLVHELVSPPLAQSSREATGAVLWMVAITGT